MNKIAESLLQSFRQEQGIDTLMSTEDAFEHFSAFLTIGPQLEGSIDTTQCVVAHDAQPSVDSIAVVANGVLVQSDDEVDTLGELNGYLDIDFSLVQSKTTAGFQTSILGDLGDFAERIFTSGPIDTDNEKVKSFHSLKDFIYTQVKKFKKRNPNVQIYYVSTGQSPKEDKNFEAKQLLIKKRLSETGLFNEISIHLVGVTELQRRFHQMGNSVTREIDFRRRVALPDIPGVTQAFIGAATISEFKKLLEGDSGNLLSSIFYDNVRDWQGQNEVNSGMYETLKNQKTRSRFVLMNNGVTVICKRLQQTGDRVVLEDYQVVNGCQTSNVVWSAREIADEATFIPLRIVATEDDAVVADIISATNSQTPVSREQLLAVTDFQKGIESYFISHAENPLFYERRSRQFSDKAIEKARIVTPIGLVKAFSSAFLGEPHKTTRDFGSVLRKVPGDIFNEKHKYDPYYLSALMYYWVEQLLRKGKIDKSLRSARYQLIYVARLVNGPDELPPLGANKISGYVSKILPKFKNASSAEKALEIPIKIVSSQLKAAGKEDPRASAFTQAVKAEADKSKVHLS
ncbi:AIPR family protein [Xanthomonas arboricola]|uniref:AIPR family protein n=1 Tax=Xanthomonas arboricola TaxID=56448 RepID=UPI003EB8F95E